MNLQRSFFDYQGKKSRIAEIDTAMEDPGFWNNKVSATKLSREASSLKSVIELLEGIEKELIDSSELINISKDDELYLDKISVSLVEIENKVLELEDESLFYKEYDNYDAILSINAGAGGVDAQDWTDILYRMYTRFLDQNNMNYQVEELSEGEEAGIKSVSLRIEHFRAYGILESERGVHRLVRISPFDSNSRRHTSFAGIDVIPFIEDEDLVIDGDDLRIDVYRSSGAGGQHVNTTDSAVRITHIPTGIVVACQAERSQLQNKNRAMQILKSKLISYYKEMQLNKIEDIRGEQVEAGWGRQIRSYVLQPYQQVKDLRTGYEVGNIEGVLNGEIGVFTKEYLKWRRQGSND